ncbi:MAG: hypothetical protein GW858_03175 [Sphingomonadales bacterium]|nr:hypothetical protein [Sphingomonadales bacterium]NCQ20851.1 hypothetical protein [Sphingomonadales bacterium]NCT02608.1 hypothetical protein [Sphingomonadales bacterium]
MRNFVFNLLHVLVGLWAILGTIIGGFLCFIGLIGGTEDFARFSSFIGVAFVPVLLLGLTIWLVRDRTNGSQLKSNPDA